MARQSVLVPVGLGDSARQCMRVALTAAQANFTEIYPLAGGVSGQSVTVTDSSRMNLRLALAKAQANITELYTLLDGTAPQNVSVAPGRAGRFNLRTAFGKLDEVFTDLYALAGADEGSEWELDFNFATGTYLLSGGTVLPASFLSNPAMITGGLLSANTGDDPTPTFIGAAATLLLSEELTVQVECDPADTTYLVANDADDNEELWFVAASAVDGTFWHVVAGDYSSSLSGNRVTSNLTEQPVALLILALSRTNALLAASVNGEAAIEASGTMPGTPPVTEVRIGGYGGLVNLSARVKAIRARASGTATADLPALSALAGGGGGGGAAITDEHGVEIATENDEIVSQETP